MLLPYHLREILTSTNITTCVLVPKIPACPELPRTGTDIIVRRGDLDRKSAARSKTSWSTKIAESSAVGGCLYANVSNATNPIQQ